MHAEHTDMECEDAVVVCHNTNEPDLAGRHERINRRVDGVWMNQSSERDHDEMALVRALKRMLL